MSFFMFTATNTVHICYMNLSESLYSQIDHQVILGINFLFKTRLEPVSGTITSVGELVPEHHRTSRGENRISEVPMDEDHVEEEEECDDRGNRRIKTTLEDWENDQVCFERFSLCVHD